MREVFSVNDTVLYVHVCFFCYYWCWCRCRHCCLFFFAKISAIWYGLVVVTVVDSDFADVVCCSRNGHTFTITFYISCATRFICHAIVSTSFFFSSFCFALFILNCLPCHIVLNERQMFLWHEHWFEVLCLHNNHHYHHHHTTPLPRTTLIYEWYAYHCYCCCRNSQACEK